jgi:hypothetical protein
VTVNAKTRISSYENLLPYLPPVIIGISGCTATVPVSNRTRRCLTSGGDLIIIDGDNFGQIQGAISVTVKGNPCTGVTLLANDT